ncbi:cytochrome b/b6 domain-containing protein [Frigidibacter oleivorans]|uniref:cytochrome b/b6 domain-containing protein n=1 Tax=Frigidibacter oleivorans TaxID=2487129 RepID=UPI000F8E9131|nr:cytochrome b/b6 domain-containing protein [Frigidibacter oleivorans]
MALANTATRYGLVARSFHWLVALFIATAFALGQYAEGLPTGSDAEVARLMQVYSLHKTIGVSVFLLALARILWALAQPRPAPVHPDRRLEVLAAGAVHWALYGAMLVMPLSGWVQHSALTGYAPILWPFGQALPFVPQSERVAEVAEAIHRAAVPVLVGAVALHVAGALKHAVIDRDGTLSRMVSGRAAGTGGGGHGGIAAFGLALLVWAAAVGPAALDRAAEAEAGVPAQQAAADPAPATESTAPVWTVTEGSLGISLSRMGKALTGSFTDWTADIRYDEATGTGNVTVTIRLASLSMGSTAEQALGPDFLNAGAFPTAVFRGEIAPAAEGHVATGTLEMRGLERPLTLPFTLAIEGDTARMTGSAAIDRRDYGMGSGYDDERTVGFVTQVDVALTATRN